MVPLDARIFAAGHRGRQLHPTGGAPLGQPDDPRHRLGSRPPQGGDEAAVPGQLVRPPREATQPITEEQLLTGPLEPTNEPYAIARIAGIRLCHAYRKQHGCNFISAMATNLYGPNDNFDLTSSHVPAMIRKFRDAKGAGRREVEIWGSGMPRREFLHVDDLAGACLLLMDEYDGDGHLNVGTGEDLEIRQLAEMVRRVVTWTPRSCTTGPSPTAAPASCSTCRASTPWAGATPSSSRTARATRTAGSSTTTGISQPGPGHETTMPDGATPSAYPRPMGVERHATEFLQWCLADGVDFTTPLTLGRQDFNVIAPDLARLGLPSSLADAVHAEPLLTELGATSTASLDASDFEGATIVHDLSAPLPSPMHATFSVVLDIGTLEHVFEFPAALRHALSAVTIGGHFVTIGPVNNDAGHGMYQFSPEMWFRALGPENGFRVRRVLLREMKGRGSTWWDVRDPALVGTRPMFTTAHPAQLYVLAERISGGAADGSVMQSDYAAAWELDSPPIFDLGCPRLIDRVRTQSNRVLRRIGRRGRPRWFDRPGYRQLPEHFTDAGRTLLPGVDRQSGHRPETSARFPTDPSTLAP